MNQILSEKEELVANVGLMIASLCDNTKLEQRQTELQDEMTVVAEMTERCVYENARVALDQEEYQSRYDGLVERFQKLQEEHDSVTARIAGNMARKKTMKQFIDTIETQEPITKFDEGLWSGLVDYVTVYSTKDIRVTFKDGTEIRA